MGKLHRKIRRGRLIDPKERFLIALFKLDTETLKVNFKGIAIDARHASVIMTGDQLACDAVLNIMAGKTARMMSCKLWYPVKITLPFYAAVDPGDLLKMAYQGQIIAEAKLAAFYTVSAKIGQLENLKRPNVDALTEALRHMSSEKEQALIPKETYEENPVVDEWNTFYDPKLINDDNKF
jgi:hypothetical protein